MLTPPLSMKTRSNKEIEQAELHGVLAGVVAGRQKASVLFLFLLFSAYRCQCHVGCCDFEARANRTLKKVKQKKEKQEQQKECVVSKKVRLVPSLEPLHHRAMGFEGDIHLVDSAMACSFFLSSVRCS